MKTVYVHSFHSSLLIRGTNFYDVDGFYKVTCPDNFDLKAEIKRIVDDSYDSGIKSAVTSLSDVFRILACKGVRYECLDFELFDFSNGTFKE